MMINDDFFRSIAQYQNASTIQVSSHSEFDLQNAQNPKMSPKISFIILKI